MLADRRIRLAAMAASLCLAPLSSPAATISLTNKVEVGRSFDEARMCVSLKVNSTEDIAGTENELVWDGEGCASLIDGSCEASSSHGKQLHGALSRQRDFAYKALILSLGDTDPLSSGDLYCCDFVVHLQSPGSCCEVRLVRAAASDPDGNPVSLRSGAPGRLCLRDDGSGGGGGGGIGTGFDDGGSIGGGGFDNGGNIGGGFDQPSAPVGAGGTNTGGGTGGGSTGGSGGGAASAGGSGGGSAPAGGSTGGSAPAGGSSGGSAPAGGSSGGGSPAGASGLVGRGGSQPSQGADLEDAEADNLRALGYAEAGDPGAAGAPVPAAANDAAAQGSADVQQPAAAAGGQVPPAAKRPGKPAAAGKKPAPGKPAGKAAAPAPATNAAQGAATEEAAAEADGDEAAGAEAEAESAAEVTPAAHQEAAEKPSPRDVRPVAAARAGARDRRLPLDDDGCAVAAAGGDWRGLALAVPALVLPALRRRRSRHRPHR